MTEPRPYRGIADGKWVYGDLITLHYPKMLCIAEEGTTQHWSNTRFNEVIPETVGQSTGKHDKKRTEEFPVGQEIYDGDIYKDAEGIVSRVEMAVDGWALFPINKKAPVRNLYWRNVCDKTKGEVTGSIHNHLLKGAE